MRELLALASVGLALVAIFLIVYFGFTVIAVILSILFNPVVWIIAILIGVIVYFKKKYKVHKIYDVKKFDSEEYLLIKLGADGLAP